MAKRLVDLVRSVDTVLEERKRLSKREGLLVRALNRALAKMGYAIVAVKAGGQRRRRRRRAGRRGRRRAAKKA
ncbi:MAG TPA: hypothetical protein VGT06_05590 [Candidatus Methylomirabilis sp.]|jgi:ParB-like chromosome segregation protein Spo0J|nr:hypothetical protein [Candidatus Methylomirabilis sp.]